MLTTFVLLVGLSSFVGGVVGSVLSNSIYYVVTKSHKCECKSKVDKLNS